MLDINQAMFDEESGDIDEKAMYAYIDELAQAFAESPEGQKYAEQFGDHSLLRAFVEFAYRHLGISIPDLEVRAVAEILFDLFPRKVSTEPDSAAAIVAELRALFTFLDRAYSLPNAQKILDYLRPSVEERLYEALADQSNYGPGKAFAMAAMAAGVDITDTEQMNAFMLEYNSRILGRRVVADLPEEDGPSEGPMPSRGGYSPTLSPAERAAQRKAKRVRDKNARRKSRR